MLFYIKYIQLGIFWSFYDVTITIKPQTNQNETSHSDVKTTKLKPCVSAGLIFDIVSERL